MRPITTSGAKKGSDSAVERLWWLLAAVGLGVLVVAMSAVRVSARA
jgi:hypothetical protein